MSPKFSARGMAAPVRFLQGALVILVFMQMSQFGPSGSEKNTVLARYYFLSGSEADSREELAGASLCAGTLSSTRCSVISFNQSNRSRDRSLRAWPLVLSLRIVAGRNIETTEFYGNDAGDVCVAELEEPVDEPGTTIGT